MNWQNFKPDCIYLDGKTAVISMVEQERWLRGESAESGDMEYLIMNGSGWNTVKCTRQHRAFDKLVQGLFTLHFNGLASKFTPYLARFSTVHFEPRWLGDVSLGQLYEQHRKMRVYCLIRYWLPIFRDRSWSCFTRIKNWRRMQATMANQSSVVAISKFYCSQVLPQSSCWSVSKNFDNSFSVNLTVEITILIHMSFLS